MERVGMRPFISSLKGTEGWSWRMESMLRRTNALRIEPGLRIALRPNDQIMEVVDIEGHVTERPIHIGAPQHRWVV